LVYKKNISVTAYPNKSMVAHWKATLAF
jgi:hypothetical protein